MATFKIVPDEDWSVLKRYLGMDEEGIVLCPNSVFQKMSPDNQETLRNADGEYVDHDFEEPTCTIDVATTTTSDCLRSVLGDGFDDNGEDYEEDDF